MRILGCPALVAAALSGACGPAAGGATEPAASSSAAIAEGHVTTDDGVRLYYRKLGSGPAVAIVPGALFFATDLDRLARAHTLILYDMRNRGRSDRVADPARISIGHDVRDLERVRAHFRAERFTPIGFSYLGMMVMLYAVEHPQRVERIVQIGPLSRVLGTRYPAELTANDPTPVPDAAAQAEMKRLDESDLATKDPRAHCQRWWSLFRVSLVGVPARASRIPDPCVWPNERPVVLNPHFGQLFKSIAALAPPSWDRFASLRMPVLTIHGTRDRQSAYGSGREWAAHLPSGRLLTVTGAAHMAWLDAPDLVVPAIDQFLAGDWPAQAVEVRAEAQPAGL